MTLSDVIAKQFNDTTTLTKAVMEFVAEQRALARQEAIAECIAICREPVLVCCENPTISQKGFDHPPEQECCGIPIEGRKTAENCVYEIKSIAALAPASLQKGGGK